MPLASTSSTVRPDALLTTMSICFLAGLVGVFSWRWIAVEALDTASDLSSLTIPSLVANAAIPVLGNGLGYFLTYRRPSRRQLLKFVGPSSLLTCVGLTASIVPLPSSAGAMDVAVTAVAVLITPIITVPLLLARRNVHQAPQPAV